MLLPLKEYYFSYKIHELFQFYFSYISFNLYIDRIVDQNTPSKEGADLFIIEHIFSKLQAMSLSSKLEVASSTSSMSSSSSS
eukprot:m.66191 g.66191  ORF g.66191 m.66191 type:complete len:82 (+) comp8183_c0_seq3:1097-1342(+)